MIDLDRNISIGPYRGSFVISFRNNAIQRWAAKSLASGNYYDLTGSIWRLAGFKGDPEGALMDANGARARNTYRFPSEEQARKIATQFLTGARSKGVKLSE